MRSPGRAVRLAAAALTIAATVPPPLPTYGGEIADKVIRGLSAPFQARKRTPPATGIDCAVEQLASQIDWLEHHVDRYGSVVAKEPDVWGQSRLTRYRREYEEQLSLERTKFRDLNNAALARSDQAYLGLALAIHVAASGTGGFGASGTAGTGFTSQQVMNLISTGTGGQGMIPLERTDAFSPLTGPDGSLRSLYHQSGTGPAAIGLEPTIHLDHLSRFLNHLHELRRINEGDDTGDSPGYALNLVRIPVSILPGKETQRGHGAEITVTADLQLGDDLLPATFRNLVINDLVDVVAPSLTFAVNDPQMLRQAHEAEVLEREAAGLKHSAEDASRQARHAEFGLPEHARNELEALRKRNGMTPRAEHDLLEQFRDDPIARTAIETVLRLHADAERKHEQAANGARREAASAQRITDAFRQSSPLAAPSGKSRRARLPIPLSQLPDVAGDKQMATVIRQTYTSLRADPYNQPDVSYMGVRGFLGEELQAAYDFLALPAQQHFWEELSGWSLPDVIRGRQMHRLEERRCAFFTALGIDEPLPGAEPGSQPDGAVPCGDPRSTCCNDGCRRPICRTLTAVLAWAILCDSALLNQRLIDDMQEAASAKGRVSPAAGGLAGPFFGPYPAPEARRAFNDYVRIRWPIRVFALDPVTQEQNVEDAFSMRRETQVAMALAASRGRAGAQAMMRYARRLETDLATIALNKTAVGFSHGSDTFGWRFYPRVQTPPTRNTLATFADTLVGTNSTQRDLADRRLEPGLRECTAIVVMPSFVPYATFDVRSNWFSLTHPGSTDLSMRKTVELSRSIKAMQRSAAICAPHAHAYRDGEVARLMRRVEQLDRELPLQSLLAQIPFENTAGGFELFNTGVTDLAPELLGWYGGTGIDPTQPTALFIVGKGFSVHDTKVIAGGVAIAPELVSREVMKITIPAGVRSIRRPVAAGAAPCAGAEPAAAWRGRPPRPIAGPARAPAIRQIAGMEPDLSLPETLPTPAGGPVSDCGVAPCIDSTHECVAAGLRRTDDAVDVHLATPYGVSGHLLIPLVRQEDYQSGQTADPGACALVIKPSARVTLTASPTKTGTWRVNEYFEADPESITIRVPRWFTPPAKGEINWTIREPGGPGGPGRVIATLSTPVPHFEACTPAYVFAGGELRNFVGDTSRPATDKTLRGAIKPHLDSIGSQPGASIDRDLVATATLVGVGKSIPIDGSLTITVRKTPQADDEPDTR